MNMSTEQNIQQFLTGFSAETTPGAAAKTADFREHLRPGTIVYITFLPGADFDATVAVAARLRDEGFIPVPHFAARSISDQKTLNENIARVVGEAGVDWVLCIAGAVDKPVGVYTDSMQLLDSGLFDKHGIKRIAVAGHPEGSPDMSEQAIRAAVKWKNEFQNKTDAAMYLVTQFAFESEPIIAWDKMLQRDGNTLPIHIGIPGLATLKTLLLHAKACGIGASMKFLTKQAKNVTKLLAVKAPDKLVRDLADYCANHPDSGITGVHMYPLGGLRRSAKWSYAVTDGLFTLDNKGGFKVDVELD
ncbi:methylenetetrahydrofolate reductase [Candidatus Spongiihabitans sp.]|uniref:methylenetetrahydrofolate reductase n=1 Tax=Candidatus Spongiihabitans sp. TaxID=3101308 RepID=UPI003C7D8EE5